MSDFVMKAGDTLPALAATLLDAHGDAVPLGQAAVALHLRRVGETAVALDDAAEVVDAAAGQVRYVWPAPQSLPPGDYYGEWEVTFSDDAVERFPNDGFFTVHIQGNIA
jgi:hypothetical protein